MSAKPAEQSVATASREGTSGPCADAARAYTTANGTIAVAIIDGIGHAEDIVALAPVLAEAAVRVGARKGALAGLLTAALLVADDRGPDESGPNAVGALAVRAPGRPTVAVWAGDVRIYGLEGSGRVHQYSSDETWGQQLRKWGMPVDVASQGDHLIRQPLSRATAATLTEVVIPADETVILTSDGVHDQIGSETLEGLFREHQASPQALADALVAAARADDEGYRDDATALVLGAPV